MRCRSCAPLPEEGRRAADLLERRWTVSILYVSHEGALRFNEFQQALGSIPPATLAQPVAGPRTRRRARGLAGRDEAGVLERAVVDARPPYVEYRLTQRGRQLRALMNALTRFA